MKRARPYNRETALDAALDLFWLKGFHATSLKDLEAALDMKPGSIYAAFSSKEALYLAALDRYFQRSQSVFRKIAAEGGSPMQALADLLRNFACDGQSDRSRRACMLVKTVLDTTSANAEISERSRLYLDKLRAEITVLIELAKSQGELPAEIEADRLARKYQALMTALRIEAHRGTDTTDLTILAEDLARDWERTLIEAEAARQPDNTDRL